MAEQTRVAAVIELGLEVKPVGGCAAAMGKLEEIHWFRRGMSVALACRAQRSIDSGHVFSLDESGALSVPSVYVKLLAEDVVTSPLSKGTYWNPAEGSAVDFSQPTFYFINEGWSKQWEKGSINGYTV